MNALSPVIDSRGTVSRKAPAGRGVVLTTAITGALYCAVLTVPRVLAAVSRGGLTMSWTVWDGSDVVVRAIVAHDGPGPLPVGPQGWGYYVRPNDVQSITWALIDLDDGATVTSGSLTPASVFHDPKRDPYVWTRPQRPNFTHRIPGTNVRPNRMRAEYVVTLTNGTRITWGVEFSVRDLSSV